MSLPPSHPSSPLLKSSPVSTRSSSSSLSPFLFFCLPSPLLHHCLHTHGCYPNIHHRFYCTRSQPIHLSSLISSIYSYSSISPFSLLLSSSLIFRQCLHTVFICIYLALIFIAFFIIVNASLCLQSCLYYVHPSITGRLRENVEQFMADLDTSYFTFTKNIVTAWLKRLLTSYLTIIELDIRVCVCVRACVRAGGRACVRACVRVCVFDGTFVQLNPFNVVDFGPAWHC